MYWDVPGAQAKYLSHGIGRESTPLPATLMQPILYRLSYDDVLTVRPLKLGEPISPGMIPEEERLCSLDGVNLAIDADGRSSLTLDLLGL